MMSLRYNKHRLTFVCGSLLITVLFTIIPLVYAVIISLFSGRGSNLVFTGLENYQRMIYDDTLIKALINNISFSIILIPIILFISVHLANCINNLQSERIKGIYSIILFFPSITSPVAYAFFFRQLFAADGFLNKFIQMLNPNVEFINYLLTPIGANIAIIVVCIWAWSGYYTILLLSAMQSIDPLIYKAARIDGIGTFKILYKITLPILSPVLLFCSVMLSGGVFQLFAEILIISKGGPEHSTITLAYYLYQLCFQYIPQFGYAVSIGILILFISGIIGFIQLKLGEYKI